jgi:hypothetical protein
MVATPLSWRSPSSWQSELWLKHGIMHVVAEAERYASHQLLGFSDKASDCSSSIPMHTGPRGILAGVCPKVSTTQSLGANGAK